MDCKIVGVDCATDPKKRGVAVASFSAGSCTVEQLALGLSDTDIADLIAKQVNGDKRRVLLALDAPLGWPIALGESLHGHHAGQGLLCPADDLFRRYTDRFVKRVSGQQSLDVGADRIARTAHSALALIDVIARKLGGPVPLAWDSDFGEVAAIEVYPAATLRTLGLAYSKYKKGPDHAVRREIASGLQTLLALPEDIEPLLASADILDAVICALAGADFLRRDVHYPLNKDLARKEGWIWVRKQRAPLTEL